MVQFGLTMFATDYSVPVDILAGTAEKLGFESCLFPSTHIYLRVVYHPGQVALICREIIGTL